MQCRCQSPNLNPIEKPGEWIKEEEPPAPFEEFGGVGGVCTGRID